MGYCYAYGRSHGISAVSSTVGQNSAAPANRHVALGALGLNVSVGSSCHTVHAPSLHHRGLC